MKIKPGTKCTSNLFGEGIVVELYDHTIPYMFYPVLVAFIQYTDEETSISQHICFDFKGNTMKQQTDTPDGIFYE